MKRAKTMKKIKTEKVDILGREYRRTVWFDSQTNQFETQLPQWAQDAFVYSFRIAAPDMAALNKEWEKRIKEYREIVKTTRKVLLVYSTTNVEMEDGRPAAPEEEESCDWGEEFKWEGSISIQFAIATETTEGKEKCYRDLNGNTIRNFGGTSYSDRTPQTIPWTQEREDTLREAVRSMHKLAGRIRSVFGEGRNDEEGSTFNLELSLDKLAGSRAIGYDGEEGK